MNDTVRQFRDFFVSLKLTVVLLVLGMILVFVATLDQVNLGIWAVQEKYFRSFFVLWRVGEVSIPVFPGGYLVGGFLVVNLVSAHLYRFKRGWKKLGIEMTHLGLILLLIGELLTGLWQEDYNMRLTQGEPKNYAQSFHDNELAIVDATDPKFDDVVVVPEHVIANKRPVQHAKLPFRVEFRGYYPNAAVRERPEGTPAPAVNLAAGSTQGLGTSLIASPLPKTYKQDDRNLPAALVELIAPEGSLGQWFVSANPGMPPQRIQHGGRTYTIALRFTRAYKPFTLTLLKFSHDRYAGTEIPKNFSSRIKLTTPDGRDDREVLIYMNNPMRYGGRTFYQASYDPNDPNVTVLQVVRNPSWLIPYIACSLMTLGLLVQFGIHLVGFIRKRRLILKTQPASR